MKAVIPVIEDKAVLVTLIRYNLEAEGLEVPDAPDGEDGLPILEERTVDVHIRRPRRELTAGGVPDVIRTVRAGSYTLDVFGHPR